MADTAIPTTSVEITSALPNLRRYCLVQSYDAQAVADHGLVRALRALQGCQPSTPLPGTFPARAKLIAAHYLALDDLEGATATELQINAGLTGTEARAAVAAAST